MVFNKIVLTDLSNFIPHEIIVCDYKNPPWFNGKIKSLFNEKLRTSELTMLIGKTQIIFNYVII